VSVELSSINREEESLELAEQYLLATSLIPEHRKDKPELVARALGTVCWSALFARDFDKALWAGRAAVALAPDLPWVELNYAHALMLTNSPDDATAIYQRELATWSEAANTIQDDFKKLRDRGLSHPQMEEVELRLKH
jgi:predicted Zn-dependent protease